MPKVDFRIQLDKSLWVEVQRLIDAGEYDNAAAVVEDALRTLVETFEAIIPEDESLEARTLKWMMGQLDPMQREQFDKVVESYTQLAEPPSDAEIVELLTMFRTHTYRKMFRALDAAQASKLPLSIYYLETMLDNQVTASEKSVESKKPTLDELLLGVNNPLVGDIAKMYEAEIAPLTEKVRDQIIMLVEDFPNLSQWQEAFNAAARMNKKNLAYVVGCLRGNGVKKIDPKDKGKRGPAKSERVRSERRKQSEDYYKRWEEKRKAREQPGKG
jgi:Arc/MetJ-type ribon-helix-helix transcriptional regulator